MIGMQPGARRSLRTARVGAPGTRRVPPDREPGDRDRDEEGSDLRIEQPQRKGREHVEGGAPQV